MVPHHLQLSSKTRGSFVGPKTAVLRAVLCVVVGAGVVVVAVSPMSAAVGDGVVAWHLIAGPAGWHLGQRRPFAEQADVAAVQPGVPAAAAAVVVCSACFVAGVTAGAGAAVDVPRMLAAEHAVAVGGAAVVLQARPVTVEVVGVEGGASCRMAAVAHQVAASWWVHHPSLVAAVQRLAGVVLCAGSVAAAVAAYSDAVAVAAAVAAYSDGDECCLLPTMSLVSAAVAVDCGQQTVAEGDGWHLSFVHHLLQQGLLLNVLLVQGALLSQS